jgi:hypothetical protein
MITDVIANQQIREKLDKLTISFLFNLSFFDKRDILQMNNTTSDIAKMIGKENLLTKPVILFLFYFILFYFVNKLMIYNQIRKILISISNSIILTF